MDRVRLSLYWPSRVSGFTRDMKTTIFYVPVVELADTLDLGSNAHQRESSSLSRNTNR